MFPNESPTQVGRRRRSGLAISPEQRIQHQVAREPPLSQAFVMCANMARVPLVTLSRRPRLCAADQCRHSALHSVPTTNRVDAAPCCRPLVALLKGIVPV